MVRSLLASLLLLLLLLQSTSSTAQQQDVAQGTCSVGACAEQQQCKGFHDSTSLKGINPGNSYEAAGSDVPPKSTQFVVRFSSYEMATQHHAQLSASLPSEGEAWSWVDRSNPAAAHPTDFGILSIAEESIAAVSAALQALPGVRDVHPDKQYKGKLSWKPEGPLKDIVLDLNGLDLGNDAQQQQTQPSDSMEDSQQDSQPELDSRSEEDASSTEYTDFSVSKRPGRLMTNFMLEDSDAFVFVQDQVAGVIDDGDQGRHDLRHLQSQASDLMRGQQGGSHNRGPSAGRRGRDADRANAQHQHQLRQGASDDPLRRSSKMHMDMGEDGAEEGSSQSRQQRKLHTAPRGGTITSMLDAEVIWKKGYSGKNVKVGIFDTGIREDHPHIKNIRERTNWTHQNSLADGLGHGTFVAGVVGSQDKVCPGFAPDVELHTFKVFTDDQVSYTSWFLDAFNYAIVQRVHIINLSIGGPDFMDRPFVDKVLEITSNGIIMISAIGNDGPLYGTLNNPADQNDVIGVGGIDSWDHLAAFSSRGMSTWELPIGYGRVKPDIMAYAKDVQGSKIQGGCRSLSGTSVASPVVCGAVCLLASTVPDANRWQLINPASMKQALVEGAVRLPNMHLYEQGSGRINLPNSMKILQEYKPRASVIPSVLDLASCPYMWPFCKQALYAWAQPTMFNATVLNGMGVIGSFDGPPVWQPSDEGGRLITMAFEYSETLWPWSGHLALFIRVLPQGQAFSGIATGSITFTITSPPAPHEDSPRRSTVVLPFRAKIMPTPPRQQRLLWDQFHSIKYPPGYIPRDNLDIKSDILDWHGDHLHTNYHALYNNLRDRGYYVEVLASPMTCFNASSYGALLLVDPEEEYYREEITKLEADVREAGLALVVFAEWYHVDSMRAMRFFDDNTRSWWTPVTGGANVPALNDLLAPFGMAFGDAILQGTAEITGLRVQVSHGANVARVPAGGYLHKATVSNMVGKATPGLYGILGVAQQGRGHVALYGDSNCLDSSHQVSNCFEFLARLLDRVVKGADNGIANQAVFLEQEFIKPNFVAPQRKKDANFTNFSWVLRHKLRCYPNSSPPCTSNDLPGCEGAGVMSSSVDVGTGTSPASQVQPEALGATNKRDPAAKADDTAAIAAVAGAQQQQQAVAVEQPQQPQAQVPVAPQPQAQQPQQQAPQVRQPGEAPTTEVPIRSDSPATAPGHDNNRQDRQDSTQQPGLQRMREAAYTTTTLGFGGIQLMTMICVVGLVAVLVIWSLAGRGRRPNGIGRRPSFQSASSGDV